MNLHGLIITFKCTKTIQSGERKLHIPLLRLPGSPSCPVSAYHRVIRLVLASSQSALFALASHYGPTILTQARFIAEFRQAISAAGLPDASSFRGHSFRRGAAPWVLNHGEPGELIQIFGDWASDAYKAYLEFSVESKLIQTADLLTFHVLMHFSMRFLPSKWFFNTKIWKFRH